MAANHEEEAEICEARRARPARGWLRRFGGGALRLVLTAGILAVVLWRVDASLMLEHLARAAAGPMLGAIAVYGAFRLVIALKWKVLLYDEGIEIGLPRICRIVFLSSFFGMVLPGGVGADALRLAGLKQQRQSLTRGAGTILADRLFNVLVMAGFSAAGVLWVWPRLTGTAAGPVVLGLSVATLGLVAVVLWRRSFQLFRWLSEQVLGVACRPGSRPERAGHRLLGRLDEVHQSVQALFSRPGLMARVLALTVVATLLRVATVWLVFIATRTPVSLLDVLAFVPMAQLLALLPITFLGLGVTEGAFAYFFSAVGVSAGAAVSVSLLSHVVSLVVRVLGAMVFLLGEPVFKLASPPAGAEQGGG
ncbi:MAG: YbhN family protein [Phycisphaeraceae bacterium]